MQQCHPRESCYTWLNSSHMCSNTYLLDCSSWLVNRNLYSRCLFLRVFFLTLRMYWLSTVFCYGTVWGLGSCIASSVWGVLSKLFSGHFQVQLWCCCTKQFSCAGNLVHLLLFFSKQFLGMSRNAVEKPDGLTIRLIL